MLPIILYGTHKCVKFIHVPAFFVFYHALHEHPPLNDLQCYLFCVKNLQIRVKNSAGSSAFTQEVIVAGMYYNYSLVNKLFLWTLLL